MRALLLLEGAYLRHQIVTIWRSPLRLAAWLPYLFFIAYLTLSRFAFGTHARHFGASRGDSFGILQPGTETGIAGMYLAFVGLSAVAATHGAIPRFRNAAEPVLYSNGGVRPLTVAVWLQLRRTGTGPLRWFSILVYGFVFYWPTHTDKATTLRAFAGAILALAILTSLPLPTFLLARGRRKPAVRGVAWTTVALGAAYIAAGFAGASVRGPLITATHVDPGRAIVALFAGNSFVLLVPVAVFALLLATVAALGDDALPELYAASRLSFAASKRARSPHFALPFRTDRIGKINVPGGALAYVWKDWIGFRRAQGAWVLWMLSCAFWAACGTAAALVSGNDRNPVALIILGIEGGLFIIFIAPLSAGPVLAADLVKPLFWLCSSPLRVRLAAWTFARAWRAGVALGLAPLAVAILFGDAALGVLAVPFAIAVYWTLQSLGVALQTLFPNPLDAGGPVAVLRFFLTVVFFVPAALAVAAVAILLHGRPFELGLTFAVILTGEGWLAIEFATFRLRDGAATLGTLSRV